MQDKATLSQRFAERVTTIVGSVPFIAVQSVILFLWVTLNSIGWFYWKWDVYPFILMNLFLSLQAAYTGPFVLISENRQAAADRRLMERDAAINRKAEKDLQEIKHDLQFIKQQVARLVVNE